jgi:hypothetical protein
MGSGASKKHDQCNVDIGVKKLKIEEVRCETTPPPV